MIGTNNVSNLTDPVLISSIANLNAGLRSAHSSTMIAALGAPQEPLDQHHCRSDQASAAVLRLLETRQITEHFKLTGIKPALDSIQTVFAKVAAAHPELITALDTEGMLCVRHKKPTNGSFSDDPSNHSWGTAVDFKLRGEQAPGATGTTVPSWLAMLVPFFNEAGWFSGISFADAMHFEVADGTIRNWSKDGVLGVPPAGPAVAGNSNGGGVSRISSRSFSNSLAAIGNFFSHLFTRG
jgi:hypothetical protein